MPGDPWQGRGSGSSALRGRLEGLPDAELFHHRAKRAFDLVHVDAEGLGRVGRRGLSIGGALTSLMQLGREVAREW